MIPEVRFVLYQDNPEIKQVDLFTAIGPDLIPASVPITFYGRRPGNRAVEITIECSAISNRLLIPFTAIELANVGNFDYSVYVEPIDAAPSLKLRGMVAHGTGLEIVAVPGAA